MPLILTVKVPGGVIFDTAGVKHAMILRLFLVVTLFFAVACGDDAARDENLNTEAPGAMDSTTKHPNGITNGSVISTDTGAMRVVDSTK